MSNYTKNTNFSAKDALTTGDPNKIILGSLFDSEFDEIATSIATKEDLANKNATNGYVGLGASNNVAFTGALSCGAITSTGNVTGVNGVFSGPVSGTAISGTTAAFSSNATVGGTLGVTGIATFSGTYTAWGSTGYIRTDIANTMAFQCGSAGYAWRNNGNTADLMTLSNAGNLVLPAPSSGVPLVLTGLSGTRAAYFNSGGAANALNFGWDVGLFGSMWNIYTASTDPLVVGTAGAAEFRVATNSTTRLQLSDAGNWSITAPSSGATLALTSLAGVDSFTNTDGTTNVASYIASAGAGAYYGTRSAHTFYLMTGGSGRVQISSAGNVAIAAPSSGTALSVTGLTNVISWSGTGGFTNNLSSDGTGGYLDAGGAQTFRFYVNSANRMQIGSSGNVTINAPSSGDALTVNGSALTPSVAVTFSATAMTVNTDLSNVFTTTFTANVTVAPTISNASDGQTINWFITQDATGSRTMTWPTSFKWPGGTAGVLSTAANSVDLLVATYRSATGHWYCSLAKAFS